MKIPRRISIPSRRHTPYDLLKIKSAALLFKHQMCRVIRILKCHYGSFILHSNIFNIFYGRKMPKCEGVTKYKCLECFTFCLYICSKFRENHDIYNEEEMLTGKFQN